MFRLTTTGNASRHSETTRNKSFTRRLLVTGLNVALLLPGLGASTFGAAFAQDGRTGRAHEDFSRRTRPTDDDETTPLGLRRSELVAREKSGPKNFSPLIEDQQGGGERSGLESSIRPDIHGTTSVENFQGTQANLSYTHESAAGFRNYLNKFYAANFARQDSAVSTWLFHDTSSSNFDLWSSGGIDYGIDGVRAAFHSSHGGMSNNVFFTSMGANWSNTGWNARSDNMALGGNYWSFGDERLRYMFWDTCFSIMYEGGNNPYTTWGPRAKGIRMIFGYDTTSVDSPNYGQFFWEEWNKNKTFKQAFLDASWRINTRQSPVVMAFGATQSDALNRRENERYLYADAVSNAWGAWSWYYARTSSVGRQQNLLAVPEQVTAFEAVTRGNSAEAVTAVGRQFGIQLDKASAIEERPFGVKVVTTDAATLVVEPNGSFEMTINRPGAEQQGEAVLEDDDLVERARTLVGNLGLDKGFELRPGLIRDTMESSGSEAVQGATRLTEKTVIFDQVLNGVPFVGPEDGHVEVTFSARGGQVTRLRNSLRPVVASKQEAAAAPKTLVAARHEALEAFHAAASAQAEAEVVPETEAVGYQMVDGKLTLVYRAVINNRSEPGSRPFLAVVPLTAKKAQQD